MSEKGCGSIESTVLFLLFQKKLFQVNNCQYYTACRDHTDVAVVSRHSTAADGATSVGNAQAWQRGREREGGRGRERELEKGVSGELKETEIIHVETSLRCQWCYYLKLSKFR